MKSILLLTGFVMSVCAQLTAPTKNYNVTSPVINGPYVVNQILPCTYRLFSNVDTSGMLVKEDPSHSCFLQSFPCKFP